MNENIRYTYESLLYCGMHRARERGDWSSLPELLQTLKISESVLSAAYLDALQWAHKLSQETVV